MFGKFLQTIQNNYLLQWGQGIVIGVSGGPDSVALLHLLWRIRENYNLKLYVVHLNHQFRGEEAEKDANFVEQLCKKLDVPAYIFSENIEKYSKYRGLSFEEGGRERRYELFNEILLQNKAHKIAIAQNLDDQAETVLMRLFRGAGLAGLGGIHYQRDHIIRPLLDITRGEIEDYCCRHELQPRIDKTNFESIYTRNRIRLELLPYIEKHFNPGIKETLSRTAKLMQEDSAFMEQMAHQAFEKICEKKDAELILSIKNFEVHPLSIQKRILREAIRLFNRNLKNIEGKHIDQILDFINRGQVGTCIDLPKDLNLLKDYEGLVFRSKKSSISKVFFEYPLKIGENTEIRELNAFFSAELLSNRQIPLFYDSQNTKYFDLDKVREGMIIRTRKTGDVFSPLGLKGTKKLKEFMIDEKISRGDRYQIPLVCDGNQVMWVVGYRISEKYKIDENTKRVLRIDYQKK
ncbi:MAG: tRNA lysidine(34) synthetase TilS [Thermotaleaceae bacterium]